MPPTLLNQQFHFPNAISDTKPPSSYIPTTPAQKFFHAYHQTVDTYGFNSGSGLRFYAQDVIYHNQNNAVYHGGEQMWEWMKKLFNQWKAMKHEILASWDVGQDNGESVLMIQMVRNVWAHGNETDKPDVSAPAFWLCRIGPSDHPDAINGLQFKEVWIYWDTMLMSKILPKDAVVFSTTNVVEGSK